ncbi:MAG TPA: hypothetical protein GXX75_05440 [Clostridiales bacterium]|nr:hypothetical protein [Clostridiales bacterium]
MERIFALYDSDFYYATRFMEYFKKAREVPFEITVFTQLESLREYLQTNFISVLLLSSDLDEDEIFTKKARYIYQFTEIPGGKDKEQCLIYKYQPVRKVMQDILADLRRKENRISQEAADNQLTILTVFTPKQRQEAFAYALGLQSVLAQQKNVLLINLELLPVAFIAELEGGRSALSEMIYYIKEKKDINIKLKELVDGVGTAEYLWGLDHAADILALDLEDAKRLMEELRRNTDYQVILFYINSVSEALMELMRRSDVLVTVKGRTKYDEALYDTWLKQLQRSGGQLGLEGYFAVELPEEDFGQVPVAADRLRSSKAWRIAESSKEELGL